MASMTASPDLRPPRTAVRSARSSRSRLRHGRRGSPVRRLRTRSLLVILARAAAAVRHARSGAAAGSDADAMERSLEAILRADPDIMRLLAALRGLRLPQWRIVSGCVYQTAWNALTGRPRGTGIKDYDLAYFDPTPPGRPSTRSSGAWRRRRRAAWGRSGPATKRASHLWFEERFGTPCPPLRSVDDGLPRYASVVHAVGVRLADEGRLDIAAPFGLDDLFGLVRPTGRSTARRRTPARRRGRRRSGPRSSSSLGDRQTFPAPRRGLRLQARHASSAPLPAAGRRYEHAPDGRG